MLYHVCVLEMELFCLFTVLSMRGVAMGILLLQHDTVLLGVLIGFVHPATITFEVLFIAIHELLDRVLLDLRIKSLYLSKRFERCCC